MRTTSGGGASVKAVECAAVVGATVVGAAGVVNE